MWLHIEYGATFFEDFLYKIVTLGFGELYLKSLE